MAKKGNTFQKREKEKARAQKQIAKEERRLESKEQRANPTVAIEGEDPDLAGIRLGPQPLPEQWNDHPDSPVEASHDRR